MVKQLKKLRTFLSSPIFLFIGKVTTIFGLIFISRTVFAGTDDLLAGTTTQALSTINGTGRNWAYIIDGAISLGAFAKTKNPFVFFSVLAVALGITVIYKMAGGS
jgi:hypothetical protein